jgi:hypothetical protein
LAYLGQRDVTAPRPTPPRTAATLSLVEDPR